MVSSTISTGHFYYPANVECTHSISGYLGKNSPCSSISPCPSLAPPSSIFPPSPRSPPSPPQVIYTLQPILSVRIQYPETGREDPTPARSPPPTTQAIA